MTEAAASNTLEAGCRGVALTCPPTGARTSRHQPALSSRKRQLQFLLEGRGRRAGLSPEELRDNGRLLGEGLSRALFNYPSRDGGAGSPEAGAAPEGGVAASQRCSMVKEYLQELVRRASDTNLKGEALHKLWPSMFAEMVRDCALDMEDPAAFRRSSLARLSDSK